MGTRGAFLHECSELGLPSGKSGSPSRVTKAGSSAVSLDKVKSAIYEAFDNVEAKTFFEVRSLLIFGDNDRKTAQRIDIVVDRI